MSLQGKEKGRYEEGTTNLNNKYILLMSIIWLFAVIKY